MDRESIIAALEAERDRFNSAIETLRSSRGASVTSRKTGNGRRGRRHLSAARRKIGLVVMKKRLSREEEKGGMKKRKAATPISKKPAKIFEMKKRQEVSPIGQGFREGGLERRFGLKKRP